MRACALDVAGDADALAGGVHVLGDPTAYMQNFKHRLAPVAKRAESATRTTFVALYASYVCTKRN